MNRSAWLHVAALSAVAVAQPLLGLLGASPEFFVAHRSGAADVLIVTVALVVLLPVLAGAAVWLAGLAGERVRTIALGVVTAGFVWTIAMQVAIQAGATLWVVAVPAAVLAAVAAALAYSRFAGVRSFLAILSIAVIVVPAVFLLRPGIRTIVLAPVTGVHLGAAAAPSAAARETPVVLVIFDELPLVSLLDSRHEIDRALYPNFAALADDGVWFRNATTVNDFTPWAVPAILTGRYPRHDALPTIADHPDSLFTLLRVSHRIEAREVLTSLCPLELCQAAANVPTLGERLRSIWLDLRVVFLRTILTADLTSGLPDPTETWAGFGASDRPSPAEDGGSNGGEDNEEAAALLAAERARQREIGRAAGVREFVSGITRDDPQPSFYFLHSLISHHPYEMLPGNRENKTAVMVPGKGEGGWSEKQPWAVAQQYQKQLLQTGYVDDLLGQLVARLKDLDLYDRALVVITSDHGVSYVPGTPQRHFVGRSAAEIIRIPLIVKPPSRLGVSNQVSAVNAESIDIVPTIADVLDLELPFPVDGSSLLDPARTERPVKAMFSGATGRRREVSAEGPDVGAAVRRKITLFGDGAGNRYRVPRLPPHDRLVGRSVSELRIEHGGGAVELMHPWEFENVDPEAEAVPFDVAGMFASPRPDTVLAVAVNGVVRAVTRTWEANPRGWLATPPLDVWQKGPNVVEVFVIDEAGGQPLLRRTTVGSVRPVALNLMTPDALEWGVVQSNFYALEELPDGRIFRWTRGWAELSNLVTHGRPREIEVEVAMIPPGPPTKVLKIEANGCTVFEGDVRNEWSATLSLDPCSVGNDGLTLRFTTDAPRGPVDRRQLGVAISRVVVK